ncbi:MAG TPA: thermonuclease family protein [Stellaceae bacterium]|jgi:endonuclease YncB( thermonuclease family)
MAASSITSKPERGGLALAALMLLLAAPAAADPAFSDGGAVAAARIVDDATLALTDGRTLRLVDIDVPERGPLAAEAKSMLAALTADRPLALKFAGNPTDRQGRVLGELYAGDVWVQGELLRRGLARVAGTADNRIGIPEMLVLERQARRYRRGLWRDRDMAILAAAEAGRAAGRFALVSGQVAGLVSNSEGVVLFFGADRHTGLVLTLAPDIVKLCRDAGLDPKALRGQTVLTRGYIDGTRRPTIAVTFPEQIEVLRQKKAAPKSLSGPPSMKER